MTLFDVEEKPLRQPRNGVTAGVSRPVWSQYAPKHPVDCNHCEMVAYETLMEGGPHVGLRQARQKRRQDGVNLLLCNEHSRIQREQDQIDFPVTESTSSGGGKRGKQFLD